MNGMQSFIDRIESPALRAVAEHWREARGTRLMPKWSDLSSDVLGPHFKLLWGFQYDPKTKEFTGGLSGEHVREWVGAGFSGARLLDIHPPQVFRESYDLMMRVVSTPSACRSSGRLFIVGDRTITGERIALPLSALGIAGDGILGASYFECPPLSGPIQLIFENLEWYGL